MVYYRLRNTAKQAERGKLQCILLLLIAIIALKTLLCKGLAIGIFLLAFWIKGRQLRFNSDEWDNFFLSLPTAKVQQYAMGIYLVPQ